MGQQQLLLVILVTIIVGVATVVAINTFSSAADAATLDAVRQDLAQIAASSQAYYMKPDMMGGGGNSFDGITFNDITFGGEITDGQNATNENGSYSIPSNAGGDDFIVTATANDADGTVIQARVCQDDMVMGDPDGGEPANCDGTAAG